jgi:hypothetical protein
MNFFRPRNVEDISFREFLFLLDYSLADLFLVKIHVACCRWSFLEVLVPWDFVSGNRFEDIAAFSSPVFLCFTPFQIGFGLGFFFEVFWVQTLFKVI